MTNLSIWRRTRNTEERSHLVTDGVTGPNSTNDDTQLGLRVVMMMVIMIV